MTNAPTHRMVNGEFVQHTPQEIAAIEAEWESVQQSPVPTQISIRQFLLQLAASGIITSQEALTSAISRQPPPAIDAIFEGLPPSDALAARITWASMVTIPRNDPLFALAGPVIYPSDTEAQIDDFFRAAGAIP